MVNHGWKCYFHVNSAERCLLSAALPDFMFISFSMHVPAGKHGRFTGKMFGWDLNKEQK